MKIESSDGQSWIQIDVKGDKDYSSYDVSVHVDVDHGLFSARNSDFQFLHWAKCIENLTTFIRTPDMQVEFEGTYKSYLRFTRSRSPKGRVTVEFAVGDAFVGTKRTHEYSLTGSFEIEEDSITRIVEKMREMKITA